MKIVTAIICDVATVREGLINVLGAALLGRGSLIFRLR